MDSLSIIALGAGIVAIFVAIGQIGLRITEIKREQETQDPNASRDTRS